MTMNKMLHTEQPYHIEGDYIALIKNGAAFLYKYLKVLLQELAVLGGGIGGFVIFGMLILAVVFTVFAVCTFAKCIFCYVF
jgi:hypothetical protein